MYEPRHFDSELPKYAAMTSKVRKRFKHRYRPRIWRDKTIKLVPTDHDEFFGKTAEEIDWGCAVFVVYVDEVAAGYFWEWSDHKRSGKSALTIAEYACGGSHHEARHIAGGSLPDTIIRMLERTLIQ